MYEQNGDFKNVRKTTVTVTEKGAGIPTPKQAQQSTSAPGNTGKPFVNAAEIGQCMNLAVQLGLVKGYDGFNDAAIRDSIQKYKATRLRFHDLYNEEAPVEKKAPAPKPKETYMSPPVQSDDEEI
jgi:hypothetical protein